MLLIMVKFRSGSVELITLALQFWNPSKCLFKMIVVQIQKKVENSAFCHGV